LPRRLELPSKRIIGTEFAHGALALFDLQSGVQRAIWPGRSLSHDSGIPAGPAAFTLSRSVASTAEVDAIIEPDRRAGAHIVTQAGRQDIGDGYAGYFQDPHRRLREVAWNPQSPIMQN
jgi:hypothetical protein